MNDGITDNAVFAANFAQLDGETDAIDDITRGQLGELALCAVRSIMSQSNENGEFKEAFLDGSLLKEAFASSAGRRQHRLLADYCVLCVRAWGKVTGSQLTAADFVGASEDYDGSPTAACMLNPRSEGAYAAFREMLPEIEGDPVDAPSFAAICEDVYDGAVKYGIIPIISGEDGVLGSFYRLIDKYDLKIAAVTDISHGDSSTRFALIRRGIFAPENASTLEMSVYLQTPLTLANFAGALESFGVNIERVNASPLTYDSGSFTYAMCLDIEKAPLIPLLLYLNMTVPDRIITGIY